MRALILLNCARARADRIPVTHAESKWNRAQRNITQASVLVTREQQTIVEVDGPGAEPFSSSPTPPLASTHLKAPEGYFARAMPFSSAVKKQSHDRDVTESAEHAALTRLAYNLSLSLPLILGIGLLFPILGFIGPYSKDTSFAMTELRNDAFAWVVSDMRGCGAQSLTQADRIVPPHRTPLPTSPSCPSSASCSGILRGGTRVLLLQHTLNPPARAASRVASSYACRT